MTSTALAPPSSGIDFVDRGLPDRLRAGVEALSGVDLSDVRVHANSTKPAQLSAAAYTQGNDIHLAPGEEKHLPHEAWHVVQQRQGRVQPTSEESGVPVNDDAALEREADVMGDKAAGGNAQAEARTATHASAPTMSSPVQLKRKGKVTDEHIQNVLAKIGAADLRGQLAEAWDLIRAHGEAYFDDDITTSSGGYDPALQKLIFRIPEKSLFDGSDTTIEKTGIAIHELTHVAEVVANTGGLSNMNYAPNTTQIMETDVGGLKESIDELFEALDKERKVFQAIAFKSSSGMDATLYGYIAERLSYAEAALRARRTNFEVPTVVNQLAYVLDTKGGGAVRQTATFTVLLDLQQKMIASRTQRYTEQASSSRKMVELD